MSAELTQEQQRDLDHAGGVPTEIVDPRSRRRYVLIPLEEYERMKDDQGQAALRTTARRTLAKRLVEGE